jgi:hypothetical protein
MRPEDIRAGVRPVVKSADTGAAAYGTVGADSRMLAFEEAVRWFASDRLLAVRRGEGVAEASPQEEPR